VAEGLLGGVLGGEIEREAPQGAPEAAVSADAFASAVAARLGANDPEVSHETSAYLREQTSLVMVQKRHLQDEHALRLAHLQVQSHLLRGQRLVQRLRISFQVLAIVVAGVIGYGLILMLYDAQASHSVVIEPFDAPQSFAARGVTGKVVAAGLLGELNRLQSVTRSSAAKRDLVNAWSNEIRLAVPEAGISIGELSRLLKARFGHDLHIDGDLTEAPDGALALTVRGDGVPAKTFAGTASELPKLSTAAAEYVYSQSEPALYAAYLSNSGRDAEAIAFSQSAYASAGPKDRPYMLNSWGIGLQNSGASVSQTLPLYRAALKLKPDFWVAYNNIENGLWWQGNEEEAWRFGNEQTRAAGGRPGRSPEVYYQNWDELTWNLPAWADSMAADAQAHGGVGSAVTALGPLIADIQVRLHDPAAAALALETTKADSNDPSIPALTHFVHGRLAMESGDDARAATEMELFLAAYANPVVSSEYPGYSCWVAPAEEAAGHPEKADAVLKTAGTFVDCYRFRADILDGRGDWPGAQKAYASAVALAPDLPAPYYSWGLALARHGDLAGAEAKLENASRRGPHWADPLKAWGDVLARRGDSKHALAKYDEAAKYAPNWQALKEARAAAANRKT
jgi:hypothetical protein